MRNFDGLVRGDGINFGIPLLLALASIFYATTAGAEESAMQRSLHAFFSATVTHDGATAELVSVRAWPKTTRALHWYLPKLMRHPSHFSLIAEGKERGRVRHWFVPVTVRWLAQVVVAKQAIAARSMLNRGMMTIQRVDISDHNSNWFSSTRDLDGMRLLGQVKRGTPIFSAMTHQLPLIRRGQLITIQARIGSIQVSTVGKALRSARRGELVMVQNLKSKRQIQAVVISANTVRTVMGGA
ncbi:MAG: flagellar basal body P-ring formation chaperone FlgA [Mariprofundales bacterium]|nr:flagellar basal body P-ring formation chaperone FlgA [Mariprofundales bacterium]